MFEICVCLEESKLKFVACTLSDRALSWRNGDIKALTLPVANSMSWDDLKVMMLEEYYSRVRYRSWSRSFGNSQRMTLTSKPTPPDSVTW